MEIFNCTHPISSDPPYTIGYVGGLQEHQNIELMLRSFKQVDSEVSFLILGGTKQRQSDLKAFSTDLGIAEEVTFIGRVSHEEVPKYINQMDICFGPFTADRTASPIKVYEYLACGREVITVNDSGLEFLDEYPGVHRITFSSPEQIAEQVEEILNRVETNNVGAEKVQDERSWRTVVDEVVETCLDVRAR
jgi:glycosyltransferase involved in cell wall biosynthesis